MTKAPAVRGYGDAVAASLKEVLGQNLVGVYLHGSAVLGGFDPAHSDVDILTVASVPLSADEKRQIAERLSQDVLPCPARGLEMSVVTLEAVHRASKVPPFELHMATKTCATVVDGATRAGDEDLVLHFAVCRATGHAMAGPPPQDIFPEIPRSWILEQMASEIQWAEDHAEWGNGVLNACRNWRYLEEDIISSKHEGAAWARLRMADPTLVDCAMARRRGEAVALDERAALAFLAEVKGRLRVTASAC